MKIKFAEPQTPQLYGQKAGWYAAYDPEDYTIVAMFWDHYDAQRWVEGQCSNYMVKKVIFPDE
jgi:hypothetical protein